MTKPQLKSSLTQTKKMSVSEVKRIWPDAQIQVAPGIYQSIEDYEANMAYDEARDNELQDELTK